MELKLTKSKVFFIVGIGEWNKKIFLSESKNNKYIFINSKSELVNKLKKYNPSIIFFIHWHWKISKSFLKSYQCIGFHMTKLPYGRGGSPLQNLILRNKKSTFLSVFKITDKMDSGPILLQKKMSLNGNAEDIYRRVTINALSIIKSKFIIGKKLLFKNQKGKIINFKRRNPEQSEIKNIKNIKNLHDFIRMLDAPNYPRAFIIKNKFKISFSNSEIKNNTIQSKVMIEKIND